MTETGSTMERLRAKVDADLNRYTPGIPENYPLVADEGQ